MVTCELSQIYANASGLLVCSSKMQTSDHQNTLRRIIDEVNDVSLSQYSYVCTDTLIMVAVLRRGARVLQSTK